MSNIQNDLFAPTFIEFKKTTVFGTVNVHVEGVALSSVKMPSIVYISIGKNRYHRANAFNLVEVKLK